MILDRILEAKVGEVAAAKRVASVEDLRSRPLYAEARRGFRARLAEGGRAVIAEIKKASPSRGVIRQSFDPPLHARQYEAGGARCLSVLTDAAHFQGSLADLEGARRATSLPLLRKDFVIDPYQVVEARAYGADCVLLIVAALADVPLRALARTAAAEGLDVLVEVHDERELVRALASGATMIGVNNRDLRTFETSLSTTRHLAPAVPDDVLLVSESGFRHPHELAQLEAVGVDAFLIGESFMREADPGAALAPFTRADRGGA